jgi:parallel beta-helix repeat protein
MIIFHNDIRFNGLERNDPALFVRCPNCLIDSNTIIGNYSGIDVTRDAGTRIVRNTISESTGTGITISTFAQVGGSEDEANTITENDIGIWVTGGEDVAPLISHNVITRNRTGVFDVQCAEPLLLNNRIEENGWGVLANLLGKPFLGSLETPGNNIIRNDNRVGLGNDNCGAVLIQAVGNTWAPNVQGADANGAYSHQTIYGPTPPLDGNNYAMLVEEAGIEF